MKKYSDAASQLSNDYYQHVRDTWSQYSGYDMPDYNPPLLESDRVVWQIEG